MTTLNRETSVQILIRELKIGDPTETSVGTWGSPKGEMRVAIIHETGHVYAISDSGETANKDPSLLFRLPVETMGVDAAIQAVERYLESEPRPASRECDMLGCHNPVTEDQGKSVAPGTYLAICDECAPIVELVR